MFVERRDPEIPIEADALERKCFMCAIVKPLGQFDVDGDICIACGSLNPQNLTEVVRRSLLSPKERKRYYKLAHQRQKLKIVAAYGGRCACCGFDDFRFLSIDHIAPHVGRSDAKLKGRYLRDWIVRHGFPPGFQILCYNCNVARGHRSKCPHQIPGSDDPDWDGEEE